MNSFDFRQRIASRTACAPCETMGVESAKQAIVDGDRVALVTRVSNLQPPPGAPNG